jgi:hypothetical protein
MALTEVAEPLASPFKWPEGSGRQIKGPTPVKPQPFCLLSHHLAKSKRLQRCLSLKRRQRGVGYGQADAQRAFSDLVTV